MPIEIINAIKGKRIDFDWLIGETWQFECTPKYANGDPIDLNDLADVNGIIGGIHNHNVYMPVNPMIAMVENDGIIVDRTTGLVTISKDIILPEGFSLPKDGNLYYAIRMLFKNNVRSGLIYGMGITTITV